MYNYGWQDDPDNSEASGFIKVLTCSEQASWKTGKPVFLLGTKESEEKGGGDT